MTTETSGRATAPILGCVQPATRYPVARHSRTHPEGWREMALRSPGNHLGLAGEKGAKSIRPKGLADVTKRFQKSLRHTPAEVFRRKGSDARESASVQGMSNELPA